MRKTVFILVFSLIFSSCTKEEETIFNISIVSTTPTSLTAFSENINVTIAYEHSKGYIGFNDPDYLSLEVKDSRLSLADYYHLQPLSPPNDEVAIKGEINLTIDAPFLLGTANEETLTFTIRIQDSSKKWSNKVTTPMITVIKE